MKLTSWIIPVHFISYKPSDEQKPKDPSAYLPAIVCADAVLVWVQLSHSVFDPFHTRWNHTRCGTARAGQLFGTSTHQRPDWLVEMSLRNKVLEIHFKLRLTKVS